jgi:hypothetical protein
MRLIDAFVTTGGAIYCGACRKQMEMKPMASKEISPSLAQLRMVLQFLYNGGRPVEVTALLGRMGLGASG